MVFELTANIPTDAKYGERIFSKEVIYDNLKWRLATQISDSAIADVELYVECLPVIAGTPFHTRAKLTFNLALRKTFSATFHSTKPHSQVFCFEVRDWESKSRLLGFKVDALVFISPQKGMINKSGLQPGRQALLSLYTSDTKSVENDVASLKQSNDMVERTIQKVDGAPSLELSRIESLEIDVASLKQGNDAYADRCLKLEETVQKLDGRLKATNAKVELLEKPVKKAPETNTLEPKYTEAHLHSQICLLTAALTLSNEKRVGSEEAVQKLDSDKKNLSQKITVLERQLKEMEIAMIIRTKKLEESEEREVTYRKDIKKQLKQCLVDCRNDYAKRYAELIDLKTKLVTQHDTSKKEFDEKETKLKEKVESMKKELEEKEEENKKTIEELREKVNAGEVEIQQLEKKLVEAKERGDSYKMGIEYEKTEVENYKKIVDVANKKLEAKDVQVNNLIRNMQVVWKDLESTIRVKNAEIEKLAVDCTKSSVENDKLSSQVKKLRVENEHLEQKLNVQQAEIKEKDERIKKHRRDREIYKKQHCALDTQLFKLKDKNAQYKQDLKTQEAEIEELKEQVETMDQNLKRCESTYKNDSITIDNFIKESAALNKKNDELEKEINELKKAAAATKAFDFSNYLNSSFNK